MMKDKNFSSILLAVMMIASLFSMVPATASADETKTVYVGFISTWHSNESESLTGWQVRYWGGSTTADANLTRMEGITKQQSVGNDYWNNAAQTFYMYKAEVPSNATGFKVHNGNTWVGSDGNLTNYNAAYIFDYGGNNYAFYDNYAESSESTEPTNPNPTDPQPITTNFDYKTVYAVGNGEGNWLNGEIWNPAAKANEMTEVSENVWQITYEDVPDGFDRQVKFAIDGAWNHNFGGTVEAFGSWSNAVYNGSNIMFDTDDYCTVTITLDLSNFDIATKKGAKFKIDYIEDVEVALAPTGYGTYYNGQCEVTLPVGVAAYVLNDATPTYVKIADGDRAMNTIPAGVAVLLYSASKPEKVTLNLNTETSDSRTFTSNKLHGSDVETTTTGGGDGAKYYKLTYGSESGHESIFGWFYGADNGAPFSSPAHKAWLALPASAGARAFFNLPGEDATGIATIENKQQKADNVWYDLNGRRINAPTTKGIYVKDGRKLVIK